MTPKQVLLSMVRQAIRQRYTSVGSYPVYIYLGADCEPICPECARENYRLISQNTRVDKPDNRDWRAVAVDVYWEGPDMHCCQCNKALESAYGDPDEACSQASVEDQENQS